jgi:hypothetical protein
MPAQVGAERVAIVVVHGIADQRPRQTVREVARLLFRGGHGAPPYEQAEMRDLLLPVRKLEPGGGALRAPAPVREAKAESARRRPGAPSGFYQERQSAEREDLGIALNDYLLGRLVLPEGDALYESTRVTLRRRADERTVDVYEMYWADLSRLATGGLRALWSLYQLFFHLGTLAADVVDQVALTVKGGAAWRGLQRLHAWMAWLLKGPIALLQLAMLLVVGFCAAAVVDPQLQPVASAFGLGAVMLATLAVLAWLRAPPGTARWAKALVLLAAAAASLATALFALGAEHWHARLYFVMSALAAGVLGAYLVERYSGVTQAARLPGHLIVLATVIALGVDAIVKRPEVTTQAEWMLVAGFNVGEWLLAGLLLAWAAFAALQIFALLLGLWLGRGCDRAGRASLHTSRLALVGSSALFAALSLVLWSGIALLVVERLAGFLYTPVVFGRGYRSAEIFLDARLQAFDALLTPFALASALLPAAALFVLLPSLLEEISPTTNVDAQGVRKGASEWAGRLGRWLGAGMRGLGTAFKWLLPAVGVVAGVAYLGFVLRELGVTAIGGGLGALLESFQGGILVATGKWLAAGVLAIGALGWLFANTLGRLRVAIDAVLDIDNYFADPPSRQPPRGRIFSRYASLLSHLRDAGYARIVIVAHSQGSVISADLLRYLHAQGRLEALVGAVPLALVTVGSPLRDLYAERFPLLYRWMGTRERGFAAAGPAPADLGLAEWVNACRSGDYVGRFIWTRSDDPARFGVAAVGPDGRVQAERAGSRTEFCLGAGAHTHYFDDDAVALAVEIERLVRQPLR